MTHSAQAADAPESTKAAAVALDRQAWLAQYRDFNRAAEIGAALVDAAPDATWRGRGHFHVAFARTRAAGPAAGAPSMQLALGAAEQARDPELDARCRDLRALHLRRAHRNAEAMQLLEQNLAVADGARDGFAVYVSANLGALCCTSLGDMERSLVLHYRALGIAHATGDAALRANAAANLGGAQTDVLNLEDARTQSAQAVALAEEAGLQGSAVWLTACFNLTTAELLGGNAAAAIEAARRMQPFAASVPAPKSARYEVLWASAALHAGELHSARHWLDTARARWGREDDVLIEWQVARAALDNRLGHHEAARATCDAARVRTRSGGEEVLPVDLMQLCDEGVRACEQLRDFEAALAYKHLAFAQYELLAGRSARARRVTAEIEHGLELARRTRDEATRRRLGAEAEQRRLAELNTALRQASETRTRFLAAASHDLRQPLHALGLQVATLQERLDQPAHREAVGRIERSVSSLAGMFDSLLDLSRIEAGAVEPQWRAMALPALLVRLVEEHMAEAERRGLRLALRLPSGTRNLRVRTDPMLLERLLRNLLSNALKYTPRGGVLVALRRGQPAARGWRVQVFDTGSGIAEDDLARVFDEFYRVDAAPKDDAAGINGLGLGLAIVRRLATLLHLQLHVRSRLGRGSCFGVRIEAPAMAAGSDAAPRRRRAATLRGLRVAVVEDDARSRQAIVRLLRNWGCEVDESASADALLARLDEGRVPNPSVLLTDYRMPGRLDGMALVARWRDRQGADAPALVVTGDPSGPIAAGLDWLPKPVSSQALRSWLEQAAAPAVHAPP